jgi:hypothetical protein
VLTPNDFSSLAQLKQRLLDFQKRYEQTASPFKWTFTRNDLGNLLTKLQRKAIALANSAANTLAAILPGNCATDAAQTAAT